MRKLVCIPENQLFFQSPDINIHKQASLKYISPACQKRFYNNYIKYGKESKNVYENTLETVFTSEKLMPKIKNKFIEKKKSSLNSGSSSGDDEISNYSEDSEVNNGQGDLVEDFNMGEGDDGSSTETEQNDNWDGNQVILDYDNQFTDDSSEIFYYNDPEIDSVGEELSVEDEESLGDLRNGGDSSNPGDDMFSRF